MQRFIHNIPSFLPSVLVLVAICYLSLASDPLAGNNRWLDFPYSDKVVHFIMYGGLTGTFCFDYYRRSVAHYRYIALVVAFVVAIAIGAVLELLQAYMGIGRSGDYLDIVANSLGAVVGIVAGHTLFARLLQK